MQLTFHVGRGRVVRLRSYHAPIAGNSSSHAGLSIQVHLLPPQPSRDYFLSYEPVCLSDHLSTFYKRFRYDGSDCQEGYRKHVHNESMYGENIYTSFLEVFVLLLFFACFLLSLFLFPPFHSSLNYCLLSFHSSTYLSTYPSFVPSFLSLL